MKTEKEFLDAIRILKEADPIRDQFFDDIRTYMYARFKEDSAWRGIGEDHEYFPKGHPTLSTFKINSDRVDAVMVGGGCVVDYHFPLSDLWTPWEEVSKKFSK